MTLGQSLFINIVIALLTALFAKERGRDPYIWFGLGLLGSFFALLALFLLPNLNKERTAQPKETKVIDVEAIRLYPTFDEHDWFYLDSERKTIGPLSFLELKKLFQKGTLIEESLVWNESETEWKKISLYPNLTSALKT